MKPGEELVGSVWIIPIGRLINAPVCEYVAVVLGVSSERYDNPPGPEQAALEVLVLATDGDPVVKVGTKVLPSLKWVTNYGERVA